MAIRTCYPIRDLDTGETIGFECNPFQPYTRTETVKASPFDPCVECGGTKYHRLDCSERIDPAEAW